MKPKRVTIHCSASKNGSIVDIDTIREWHLDRGFKDVGYHVVIQPDGEIQLGRPFNKQGAHVRQANADNIGICLVGNDAFTLYQFDSLRYQLHGLEQCYDIKPWEIYCHHQWPSALEQGKKCPNIPIQSLLVWYTTGSLEAIRPYILKGGDYGY